jgi:hypothetical protein
MSDLKKFIKEVVKQTLKENFVGKDIIQQLKSAEDVEHVFEILEQSGVKKLGEGSSRSVYRIATNKVIKVAGGERADIDAGMGQNQAEVSVYTNPTTKNIVPIIYDYHPDFWWIISERVNVYKSPVEFQQDTGLSSAFTRELIETLSQYGVEDGKILLKHRYDVEKEATTLRSKNFVTNYENAFFGTSKDFFEELLYLVTNNELIPADIRYDHFGKTANGRIVLLDSGYDMNVYKEYY